jgi:PPM family protein phosphatase
VRFAVKTDKGMIREINEDSCNVLAGYPGVPVSFIIADGMGGHNSGEIASKMAVDFVSSYVLEFPEKFLDEENIQDAIVEVIKAANNKVFISANESPETIGMGTTLIIAVICNKKLYIGHVGDSRVYLIRDNIIEQLTTDHSFIEELLQKGSISKTEAENHPRKHVITRAIGCIEDIEADIYISNIKDRDIFILCTDGLTNMLNDDEIYKIAQENEEVEGICNLLVDMANEKGGEDNITVMAFNNCLF